MSIQRSLRRMRRLRRRGRNEIQRRAFDAGADVLWRTEWQDGKAYYEAEGRENAPYDAESAPAHIRACTWPWGDIETKSGNRGWMNYLCSNQVATCS